MSSWIIDIILDNSYTSKAVMRYVDYLRGQQYIRYNSMFNIEINGFDDYTIHITTDYDGVKDAVIDTCEREKDYWPHTMIVKEAK